MFMNSKVFKELVGAINDTKIRLLAKRYNTLM